MTGFVLLLLIIRKVFQIKYVFSLRRSLITLLQLILLTELVNH
nr:MAG TPA: hypothetical protein [Caudoviricetes sp.]